MQTFKMQLTNVFFKPHREAAAGLLQVQQSGRRIFLQGGLIDFNIACCDPVKIKYCFHSLTHTHAHTNAFSALGRMLCMTCVSDKWKLFCVSPTFYCCKLLKCVKSTHSLLLHLHTGTSNRSSTTNINKEAPKLALYLSPWYPSGN